MANHRSITITSTIGKTYEHIIKKRLDPLQKEGLQFVFSEYEVRQGVVGQGRIISSLLYKAYMDGPLAALHESGHRVHIGTTYMGLPACADDILLACDRDSAQPMLNITDDQACNRRFNIQPLKSVVSTRPGAVPDITLGTDNLPHEQCITHMGITRNMNDVSSLVADRIETARNIVYALMPAGMQGEMVFPSSNT